MLLGTLKQCFPKWWSEDRHRSVSSSLQVRKASPKTFNIFLFVLFQTFKKKNRNCAQSLVYIQETRTTDYMYICKHAFKYILDILKSYNKKIIFLRHPSVMSAKPKCLGITALKGKSSCSKDQEVCNV